MKNQLPATLLCDFYKVSHREQYPQGTEVVYSTFIPRSNKFFPQAKGSIAFGLQGFVKDYLINFFNENFFDKDKEEVVEEYSRVLKYALGIENPYTKHIEELHDLRYLPIQIKSVKEGTLVPIGVPMLTIENTLPEFFWVTNYLETILSNQLWLPCTSATTSTLYRNILDEYAIKTTGSTDGVDFQGHDFSMRGMQSLESAMTSGAGHLVSFLGSDTIPAINYVEQNYNSNIENELIASSIPATEHSVMCAYGDENEFDLFKRLITEIYPKGFFSVVSDTWDFWQVVGEYLPKLKNEIMARDGRVVIRPDSGNPADILCGNIKVDDYTNYSWIDSLEEAKEDFAECLVEEVRENTEHGECGENEISGVFKYEDKYYKLKVSIEWNRYDKQYYYIDGSEIESFQEYELSLENKGLIECLWDTFGGAVNEQGYKVLDSHIGAIYGDSITLELATEICKRLEQKGFASTNVVYGIGSYTYTYKTRDSLGFAIKASYAVVNGEERMLFKNPKTDDGTKKSLRGKVRVVKDDLGNIKVIDGLLQKEYLELENQDILEDVFVNGKLVREQTFSEIRKIARENK